MDSQRSILVIGLFALSFMLWQQWNLDYGPKPVQTAQVGGSVPTATSNGTTEDVPVSETTDSATQVIVKSATQKTIEVTTDTLHVSIDTRGGDVVKAQLRRYPLTQGSPEPITILNNDPAYLYIAQSGLIGRDGPDASAKGRPVYRSEQDSYQMTGEELRIPLQWQSDTGVVITKEFIFKANSHAIEVTYTINNQTDETIALQQYAQLKQTTHLPEENSMFMPTYRGGAYSTEEDRYTKYTFDDITDENLKLTTKAGWVSMLQHYFVSAWIPPQDQTNNLYSRALNGGYASIGYTGEPVAVAPKQAATITSTLYVGPKIQDDMAALAENLDLTVDYGFLWWLAQPLFWLLQAIQTFVINWGFTIIVITILVKGAMYWLTKAQYESMAKMRALQPKMQALKERFGEDRQKMSQAMMELYRKEKVNPMGGCFPLLLQMPIFLSLYWVLLESVELRHADFVLWITDLSVPDPFFVLPVLTGVTMYMLQRLQPMTIQDPMQQKIMQWMPVAMSIFFFMFPAGLVLYWLISNVITLVQAKMIYSAMDKKGLKR
ncbi:membrane protein insertase YidC [Paraneptunicella aestuarii]|uniref:membrane protein insertase YidC n=1 Tax=Paraneptunicella aestuarii TaxID=2831148 RepID=UPI001E57149A|nr:membrane protein insertase YidC [Paraneptunicella aestuarii]UAA38797.1 membrane protein insertase YidC [Paraneptunicella aestuarii]